MQLTDGTNLIGYGSINIVLGKNGSGKSTLLRTMDATLSSQSACIRYVTPERGGKLTYQGNIETNLANDPHWLTNTRRQNQWAQFREASVADFRNLETLVLRSIEQDKSIRKSSFSFDDIVAKINSILDRVQIQRTDALGFDLVRKNTQQAEAAAELSSGESELVSLSIEILYYSYLCKLDKHKEQDNWLLLDEPDVHLHPDLQNRLMRLLIECTEDVNGKVLIATHSTTIVSSLCSSDQDLRICLKEFGTKDLQFHKADEVWRTIFPMFGAHPLSNVFNEKPPLIVEGEDDERIWNAAVRHSNGRISVYPCVAGDVQSMNKYERTTSELIKCVYDNAKAFSLRDCDEDPEEIEDEGLVIRFRLRCRNAENLLLTDDVLEELQTDWQKLQKRIEDWIDFNSEHPKRNHAVEFRCSNWDRRRFEIKQLRNIIVGLSDSTKPWEVAVGRAVARLPERRYTSGHCLEEYIGEKLLRNLKLLD